MDFTTLLIYVDDILLAGNSLNKIEENKRRLDKEFSIKDLGNARYFLGMEIGRSSKGIQLYQRKYTIYLLKEWDLVDTGFCFYIGSSLISWRRRKQATMTKSSSGSEYRALSQAVIEAQWILYIL
uniref:Reverse transcriptase Ty1/copia-type domain-containing protein n=1 Tax=Cajanus cajan TaxID=3821 RepID=A0A151T8J3_CAJCA|nr:hypothetical protein KK1_017926 [Cajanus cajan]